MRHQFATVHELARIQMLAGLPGETLGKLAERMERLTLAPGDTVTRPEGHFTVVVSGMLRTASGALLRPSDTLGGLEKSGDSLTAVMPSVVASCDQAAFDELVRPGLTP
jgi:hypothetical protein